MSNDAQEYNLATIRQLLLAAFTPEDLRRFCLDRPTFQPIVAKFGPGLGLDDMVDRVIDYCWTRLLWYELLVNVSQVNPRTYVEFYPRLGTGAPPPRDLPPPPTPPPLPKPERPLEQPRNWFQRRRWAYIGIAVFSMALVLACISVFAVLLSAQPRFDQVRYQINDGHLNSVTNQGDIQLQSGDALLFEEIWYLYRGLPIGSPKVRVEIYIRKEKPEPEFEGTTPQVALSTGRSLLSAARAVTIEEDYWDQVILVLMLARQDGEAKVIDRFYIDLIVEPTSQK